MVNLSSFHERKCSSTKGKEDSQTSRLCRVRTMAQLDQDSVLPRIGRDTFYLQGLVPDPSEECIVRRGEFAEALGNIFVVVAAGTSGGLTSAGHLLGGVLAKGFVRGPVGFLTLVRLGGRGLGCGKGRKGGVETHAVLGSELR